MLNFKIFLIFILSFKGFASINEDKFLCIKEILKIEKKLELPRNLLLAISLTETGRLVDGIYVPWPWALNIKGKGFYLSNQEEAKKYALFNIKNLTQNVDIGCMQINYYYHGANFAKFDDIINPNKNVLYAGYFLIELKNKYNSWKEAIMRYHSSNPKRKKKYYKKVLNNWSYLGSDLKVTRENKEYTRIIEALNKKYESDFASGKVLKKDKNAYFDKNKKDLIPIKDMPKVAEELDFIQDFTFMSKEDIINSLERIKDYKKQNND